MRPQIDPVKGAPFRARSPGYLSHAGARDQWILSRRSRRNLLRSDRPYAFFVEQECAHSGETVSITTIFLTNRECPWRCLMCDLWKNTLTETVPVGAIPAQIDYALAKLGVARGTKNEQTRGNATEALQQIKLYNSGSFFDPRAILPEDYPAIAQRVALFERVIVESHPALIGERTLQFREFLQPAATLEVAMGLETAHPDVLEKLNKRMTLDHFADAAAFLRGHGIALRVFVLVKPPFLDEAEALHWAKKSIDFAFDCGASVVSLIPTRLGNGALETLAEEGAFLPPRLGTLEAALAYGVDIRRGRVFADLWDLEKFSTCGTCFPARCQRLRTMNVTQAPAEKDPCPACDGN